MYEKTVDLGVKGIKNPKNYEKSSEKNPRIVKLYPKETYINIATSTEQDSAEKAVNGGNKIYIDYNTDINNEDYEINPLEIKITGLAADSIIENKKCTINVKDVEYSYRPIDVANPFINSKWEKGENWINDEYDFTKTIHSNTWSESTRNEISIPANDISEIKNSNANYQRSNYSPYMGICDLLDGNDLDSITKAICNKIK